MEDLILTSGEHKVLKRFQKRLQNRYNVEIHMPKIAASVESDVIFASINGEKYDIERVKKFLSQKMDEKVAYKENVVLITLSDSEEEETSSSESDENSVMENLLSSESSSNSVDQSATCNALENSVYIIESPIPESSSNCSKGIKNRTTTCNRKRKKENFKMKNDNFLDNSVCIIESTIPESSSKPNRNIRNKETEKQKKRNFKINKKVRSKGALPASEPFEEADICEVSSTTEEVLPKKMKVWEETTKELEEFIPLHSNVNSAFNENESSTDSDNLPSEKRSDDIIVLEPSPAPRPLRPIVIDGSNVAREHGKVTKSYSAKGIQIAVDFFLNRGHTQVTAFLPKFRRHCTYEKAVCPTTNPEILDELERKQLVVFTPSRRLNGKCINAYDDRFIIQLASATGGIIVSNDNFRDLAKENDSFKDAIENRLLMFCFVGDIFMVPDDPLGRDGPTLSNFLSFPPDQNTS